ncbi:hypothetical protein DI09_12p90 [Mitosporidium daphniae]|uniref:GPI mannosyltransferase 1 n=1 Tax=Mitosporidium daphniae TaxID=1485682 RepID=A0A098VYM4_9MICR|nr:uncharacterized protein DI09_12p90 [Mitosporidium daphniae]KGG52841.1 hypothetical protein DI09_12p90 [Mitosporidium daphniae]|eukprot:XP_013239313.1 uncharacterized protein DI09_12p90 [Mitosporidium daphniae]
MSFSIWPICFIALLVRIAVSVFSLWYDSTHTISFTDIDYFVLHDAAGYVFHGNQSPYTRETYRYTPFLAYLLLSNFYFDSLLVGKLLFSVFDVGTGILLYFIQINRAIPAASAIKWTSIFWLFNPFVIAITCRGNAESIICFFILLFFYFHSVGKTTISAILYGLCVHLKIFPILFSVPILANFYHKEKNAKNRILSILPVSGVVFAMISGGMFFVLLIAFYLTYGFDFLYETYLYHLSRKDHRHNMSIYFYYFYLLPHIRLSEHVLLGNFLNLACFVPQFFLTLLIGFVFCDDLAYAFFLVTYCFVSFNKVCTSQYFVWYILFLPLAVHSISIEFKKILALCLLWVFSQAIWLYNAYRLEFLGENAHLDVFLCSCLFFISNIAILAALIEAYNPHSEIIEGGVKED